ncbi:hypothetical protein [Croceitalea vernalis]|uniref:Haem-binding domain-containing protein n=1 Tax=Croceitalea vernalis TaxID=3075599 RepID=A0ABU3BKI9_9FLAO|nr:hypothetical protein [Croceitalea sp. P007]MDT0622686.1 hypothetical protein [Croceitalea sp. P007]
MMVTLVKFLIGISIALLVNSTNNYQSIRESNKLTEVYVSSNGIKESKPDAFQILDHKCNVCHRKRNKKRVFTTENMNTWADDIYTQVFVKKRMPKSKKIKLTSKEYQDLLTWISSTRTSTNGI